jgi:HAD superfamily hydrolase (TIGR01509 family)
MAARFQAVVFDNDGLLLDTEAAWTRAEEDLFARRGRVFTPDHKRALIGTSPSTSAVMLEAMLDRPGEGEALAHELHELVMEEALNGVSPREGALELIDALRAAGVPLAVASNSRRQFVERVLAGAGLLNGSFEAVVTADDVAQPKPAPDLYLYACSALGAAPERSAALEDSPVGVASALAAGLYVVAVPYFADTRIEGASLTARTLADPEVAAALGV